MQRILRIVLVMAAIAAMGITTWAFSPGVSGARAGAKRSLNNFWPAPMPSYPMAQEMPLSEDMTVGRSRMKMVWFQTADEPIKVAAFYRDFWESAGYYVTQDVHPYGGKVASMDLRNNLLRQVVMTRDGGMTTVYVSLIMGSFTQMLASGAGDTQLPVMPGAEGVTHIGSRDQLANTSVLVYVDREDMDDNVAFYMQEMALRGYRPASENARAAQVAEQMGSGVRVLVFSRDSEEVTVTLTPVEDSGMVRVHITRVRGKGE